MISYFPPRPRVSSLPSFPLSASPLTATTTALDSSAPVDRRPLGTTTSAASLGRRSLSGLSKLFALDEVSSSSARSSTATPCSSSSSSTTPPITAQHDPPSAASSSTMPFSTASHASLRQRQSPASQQQRPSSALVRFPSLMEDRRGKARAQLPAFDDGAGGGGSSAAAPGATLAQQPKVNGKKVRIAIRLLEELEGEAQAYNQDAATDQEEEYIAHLLTLSLSSALASVPPQVQAHVFTQSPQLQMLPRPGVRFDVLFGDADAGWKERAAEGLSRAVVWVWVSGLPVLLQLFACLATLLHVAQVVLIRLRVVDLLEFYLLAFLRFLASSPALEQLRALGADVAWVLWESARRGLGRVLAGEEDDGQGKRETGGWEAGREGRGRRGG